MKLMSVPEHGKPAAKRNLTVFWIIGVIVCYQAAYQLYMSSVLHHEVASRDPWCDNSADSTQQCVEAQLFRGWEHDDSHLLESQDKLEALLQPHGDASVGSTTRGQATSGTSQLTSSVKPAPSVEKVTMMPQLAMENSSSRQQKQTPWAKGLIAVQERFEERMRQRRSKRAAKLHAWSVRRHKRHARAADAIVKEWHNMSALSRELQALHERFGARLAQRRANTQEAKEEWSNLTAWARDVQALQRHFEGQFTPGNRHVKLSTAVPGDNMTAWSRDLASLQQQMQARMDAHNKAHAALNKKHSRTKIPLIDRITALARELCMDPKRVQYSQCAQFVTTSPMPHSVGAAAPKTTLDLHRRDRSELDNAEAQLDAELNQIALNQQSWEKKFVEKVDAVGRDLCSDPRRRWDSACKKFFPANESINERVNKRKNAWHQRFAAKIANVGRELCSNPMRRGYAVCKKFFNNQTRVSNSNRTSSSASTSDVRNIAVATLREYDVNGDGKLSYDELVKFHLDGQARGDVAAKNTNGENEIMSPALVMGGFYVVDSDGDHLLSPRELHKLVSMYHVPLKPAAEDPPRRSTQRVTLNWGAVTAWQAASPKGLRGSASTFASLPATDVSRLRTFAHWSGRIPTVACVTLVPKGNSAKAWLQYFVDNFRAQSYEGMHQLILVHHHSDPEIGELIRKYADGSYIRSAVARGSEFPSAAAFRFGAWLARDADVVARWDFEAWHHPQRLSAQVRALAFSGRPACLLASWTVLDKSGANSTAADGTHWDGSLVGEAAWMRANWYPQMGEERAVFDARASRELVKIEMPSLEVFDETVF